MEHCRSPDGVTSVSVRPYYAMLSRVYLVLAMGFLVIPCGQLAESSTTACLEEFASRTSDNYSLCLSS